MSPLARLRAFALGVALVLPSACERPPAPPGAATPKPVARATPSAPPLAKLPSDVTPTRYRLALEIDPAKSRFSGEVSIDVMLAASKSELWLHGEGLDVTRATVTAGDGAPLEVSYAQVHEHGVARLELPRAVGPGRASLHLAYHAPFDQRLSGLYQVRVEGDAYAFTQMEPVAARKAFPCFDEPRFKTPFEVSITGRKDHAILANTREIGRRASGDRVTVDFAPSEPLPTYLVAFAVGPLDVVAAPDVPPNGVRKAPLALRGVAAKGRGPELAYALSHTPALLARLEEYFALPYPYDKLDIIAVPDKEGAMENAGAVTFREWLLLVDEARAPVTQKRAFAIVMAHELAHQWFGNLVTMPWWDDIWLNEAFATWMGYRTVHEWRPDHQADVLQLERALGAMAVDSLASARRIRQPVNGNDDIHSAFDRITYQKGGAVLGMFERWLGAERFRAALRSHVARHRHATADADDLLASFDRETKLSVGRAFRTFLDQPGIPLFELELACTPKPSVSFRQSRYLPLGSQASAKQSWIVPLCLRYPSADKSRETCTLVEAESGTILLEGGECPRWVMPNAQGAGYFLFDLAAADLDQLMARGFGDFDVREKTMLATNLWYAFARGAIDVDRALALLEPLFADAHPAVAAVPMALTRELLRYLEKDPLEARLKERSVARVARLARKVGWDARPGDPPETRLLRQQLLSFLALSLEHGGTRRVAIERARAHLGLGEGKGARARPTSPELVPLCLTVLGQEADAATFDLVLAKLEATRDEEARSGLLAALAAVREPALAQKARELTFDARIKVSETPLLIQGQLADPHTRQAAWNWLKSHVDRVFERISPRAARAMPELATLFCSDADAADAEQLFRERLAVLPGGSREVDKAREAVALCAARRKKHTPALTRLLSTP
jgi:alanyl aminopeptidase